MRLRCTEETDLRRTPGRTFGIPERTGLPGRNRGGHIKLGVGEGKICRWKRDKREMRRVPLVN